MLVDLESDRTTVRELIRRAVTEQIRLLGVDLGRRRDIHDRQYLLAEEIRVQAASGVIRLPTPPLALPDVTAAVARAHRAFERNVFVVFVGGRQVDRLDDEIVLRPDEPVVFLRLTALAGG
ncbi:hypothetical protein ABZ807_30400 [Micromonospora sp. NPDC047548]|uniref:hypothetical protein n=1 Tax=Micromonospora sp. NPDC047548 TaxID=3155624 RepID=UPI0034033C27